jgi:hypothetical protein
MSYIKKFSVEHKTKCVCSLLILKTVYAHRLTFHKKQHKLNRIGSVRINIQLRHVRVTILALENNKY